MLRSVVASLASTLALLSIASAAPAESSSAVARNASIIRAVAGVSAAHLRALDERLVGFGTRNLYSEKTSTSTRGVYAARAWMRQQFEEAATKSGGRMSVDYDTYVEPKAPRVPRDVEVSSVIATLHGDDPAAPTSIVSSHYDSRNGDGDDPVRDAPGADDNGSGTVAVIEAARALAPLHFRGTIVFACFDGEEQGLFGSGHYAQVLHERGVRVAADLNNDIIGASSDYHGHSKAHIARLFSEALPLGATRAEIDNANAENDSPSRELARFVASVDSAYVPSIRAELQYMDDRWGRGGDQQSFTAQGYAAVRFVEPFENYEHQHQDVRVERGVRYGDLPQYMDFPYLARVTQMNVAAIAALAAAPDAPSTVEEDRAGFTYVTRLRWSPARAATSYEVVWRPTTAVQWNGVRNVGDVTRVTLPMNKDLYHFGVRAVDAQGNRSPVVYPAAARFDTPS